MTLLVYRPGFALANATALTVSNVKDITGTVAATLVTGTGTQTASTDHVYASGNNAKFAATSGQNSVARFPLSAANLSASYDIVFWYSGTPPTLSELVAGGRRSGGNVWGLSINTTGKLVFADVANQWTSTAALSAGWYRVAVWSTVATTSTGSAQVAYYLAASNTAIETSSTFTALNLGTANQTEIEVGRRGTGASAFTLYVAGVQSSDGVTSLLPADTVYGSILDAWGVSAVGAVTYGVITDAWGELSNGTYGTILDAWGVTPSSAPTVDAGPDTAYEPCTVGKLNATSTQAPAAVAWTQVGGLTVTIIGSGLKRAYLTPAVSTSSTLTFQVSVTPAGGGSPVTDTVVHTVYPQQHWQLSATRTLTPAFLGGTPTVIPDP